MIVPRSKLEMDFVFSWNDFYFWSAGAEWPDGTSSKKVALVLEDGSKSQAVEVFRHDTHDTVLAKLLEKEGVSADIKQLYCVDGKRFQPFHQLDSDGLGVLYGDPGEDSYNELGGSRSNMESGWTSSDLGPIFYRVIGF